MVSATSGTLAGQSKVLVDDKFANGRVTGGEDGKADDGSLRRVSVWSFVLSSRREMDS